MASRIVSFGGNDHIISPVLSSTTAPSIVSVDSILPHKSRQTQSVVQEAPRFVESWVKGMSSLVKPSTSGDEIQTSTSACTFSRADAAGDDSFVRHDTYFSKDGNVTFLVDGTLYCVHRYFFSRDSVYFSTRFDQLGVRDHEALPITISLGNIKCKDFDAFLSILYPADFEQRDLSYEEWKSVLHLSTCWDFTSIRRLALNNIQPPTPHDRLILARTYSVDHWVVPALSALCEREAPLSLEEVRQMNIEDVVLVATVRENIRSRNLQVDAAEIPHRVEAAQAGKLVRADGFNIPPTILKSTSGYASSPILIPRAHYTDDSESDGEVPEKSETPRAIGVGTGLMQFSQAEVTARCEAKVEDVRRTMNVATHKAEAEHEVKEARVANLEAEAEEGKPKAVAEETKTKAARRKAARQASQAAKPGYIATQVKTDGTEAVEDGQSSTAYRAYPPPFNYWDSLVTKTPPTPGKP